MLDVTAMLDVTVRINVVKSNTINKVVSCEGRSKMTSKFTCIV